MTIFGWDASQWDDDPQNRGRMDLKAARADGIQFFTHKATEVVPPPNQQIVRVQQFGTMIGRARDAGIPFLGPYVVIRNGTPVSDQVDILLAFITNQAPWWKAFPGWFFQVDLEDWQGDKAPGSKGEEMAALIRQRTGKAVVLYASQGQYGGTVPGKTPLWNANYPLWIAKDGASERHPYREAYRLSGGDRGPGWTSYSGRTPVIWQFTDNAIIGSQVRCCADAFRGTVDDFAKLIGVTTQPPGRPVFTNYL
jgi:hypothetical protein